VVSSIRPTLKLLLANARMAAWAPGPGVFEPVPPGALTLMWIELIPLSRAASATYWAAFIAAYGDGFSLSALTKRPPDAIAIVSAPVRSVMWTIVLLKLLRMLTIPHFSDSLRAVASLCFFYCQLHSNRMLLGMHWT